ncbi:hypothetical protein PYW08_010032 [Mythimna loreyi]|uniref:Uncharacterized protein n=1 Tax=Mythimna loreyi TaxID=667449 RepID=A0ACC2Q8Z5_9NEOP|nr:hypothetical protein PYW08_010032 [Mythimna loreyi]
MRTSSIAIFLCIVAAAACQSHDLVVGQQSYGDVIVYKTDEVKYAFPLFIRTSNIEYPPNGQTNNHVVITAIYIKDNKRDGSGGYPTIKAGGVGQNFVRIKLETQRGEGMNFTITIYGRYL